MLTIRDVMTRSVITVSPETPLKDVAQILVDRRISGVPVVDSSGRVLGVVSEADLLLKEQPIDALAPRRFGWLLGEGAEMRRRRTKMSATTAGQAMTSPAVTIWPSLAIAAAAERMTTRGLNRLPVVDRGELVGIVTRADLIRAFVRSDADLLATIRDDVFRRILWLDPDAFHLTVSDGVVSVAGRAERRSTALAIEDAIAMVPGVVTVKAEVGWLLDDRSIEPATSDPVFPFGPH